MRRTPLQAVFGGLLLLLTGGACAEVPLDGYFPLVGIGLSNEFDDDFNFYPEPEFGLSASRMLGPAGTPTYDLALLDTGAGFSVFSSAGFDHFELGRSYPGESDGYNGTEFVTIGGATGQLNAPINDPLGIYASGLQDRSGAGAALTMNNAALNGQTNTATITLPPESDLPNILGLPFASQYATHIRSDQPQVFQLEGRTIRSPGVSFEPLGSGGGDITRKAPLSLNPGAAFAQPPAYLPNIVNFDIDNPQENPSTPTLLQGALFVNASVENGGESLGTREFFFDTGASVTVLSEFNALLLGFDVTTDEPEFSVSIVGSGGTLQDVPGFFVDELTIPALGGSVTATNVPVLVLDVTDPSDPGNVVEGILGTNLLSGRNAVIDPNPSLGGGGESAGLYISDPVTSEFAWSTAAASAAWSAPGSWQAAATPDLLSVATLEPTGAADQTATVTGDQQAWTATVRGGSGGESMRVEIGAGDSLTTFSGVSIEAGGAIALDGGVLDAQYLDVRGGRLEGSGEVRTGSGPIEGQIEAVAGAIAPDGLLTVDGRLSLGSGGSLEFDLFGAESHDQLALEGTAGFNGELVVDIHYTPSLGDAFDLVTHEGSGGAFAATTLPEAYEWELEYLAGSLRLEIVGLAGDFNSDGAVDAADYVVWRNDDGATYTEADLLTWKANYGATLAPSASLSVPEPAGALLLAMAAFGAAAKRR